ncbi:MAG TPA: hypothetical protein PLC42_04750 [Parachlamydiaceae bacterium]|nr:hypothetical protein [Parachlamydiaceae bacterium]
MNLNKLFLFFILTAFCSSCQKPTYYVEYQKPELASINLVDRNGMSETISQKERLQRYSSVDFLKTQPYQKVLRVFTRDVFGSIKAIITSYYPNGQLKQYLEVKDNRAFGPYREWFADGTLKLETYVIGGLADLNTAAEKSWLFDGLSKAYDEHGNLAASIEYHKGELTGNSRYYHTNSNLWKIIPFCKNEANGTFKIFLENGDLLQTSELKNSLKNGKTIRYWNKNQIAADETYDNGKLISAFYYNMCGKLIAQVENGTGQRALFGKNSVCELQECKNGVPDGEVKIFDPEGELVKIYHVKNEMKHGEEIEFFEGTKQPKLSIFWWEGKIHGVVKTWYENGTQESQREMTNNMKNGLLTAWYLDGSVMLLESYEYDTLLKGKYFRKQEKIAISEVNDGNGTATLHDKSGNLIKRISYVNGKPQS